MTTKIRSGTVAFSRAFSGDLSKAIGERRFLSLVLDVVQTVESSSLEPQGGPTPRFRPKMMLTLVTYCYGASLFGSRDIEYAIGTDPHVRYICARTYPPWRDIRTFRRQHREVLRHCLTEVFRRVWAIRFADASVDAMARPDFDQQLEVAVDGRLDTAALMDGVESD